MHGPTHLTGKVRSADQGGDLPVGQDLSGRDGAHHAVHLFEKGSFFRLLQWRSLVALSSRCRRRPSPYRSPHFSLRLRMSKKLLPGDSINSTVLADLRT